MVWHHGGVGYVGGYRYPGAARWIQARQANTAHSRPPGRKFVKHENKLIKSLFSYFINARSKKLCYTTQYVNIKYVYKKSAGQIINIKKKILQGHSFFLFVVLKIIYQREEVGSRTVQPKKLAEMESVNIKQIATMSGWLGKLQADINILLQIYIMTASREGNVKKMHKKLYL